MTKIEMQVCPLVYNWLNCYNIDFGGLLFEFSPVFLCENAERSGASSEWLQFTLTIISKNVMNVCQGPLKLTSELFNTCLITGPEGGDPKPNFLWFKIVETAIAI
jgi:hypothetical protein